MAHKVLIGGTAYAIKGGKTLINGTGYSIKKGRTLINGTGYDINFLTADPVLNNNDWATISAISSAGMASNYWSVGDCHEVTLNGTVATCTWTNYSCYAYILGFNHNSSLEGSNRIHFQLAKTAQTGGTDVCFTDPYYGDSESGFRMNTTPTNSGGWRNSNMRNTLCGTSLTSYSGTFIGVIPAALRAALKSVTKYTNNTGKNSASSAVTATTDYIFLLAEYEVFGATTYANSTEASYQAQYAYYSAGNSKIKYKHSDTTTTVFWWLRTPNASTTYAFVFVNRSGYVGNDAPDYSYGFAPCFCV